MYVSVPTAILHRYESRTMSIVGGLRDLRTAVFLVFTHVFTFGLVRSRLSISRRLAIAPLEVFRFHSTGFCRASSCAPSRCLTYPLLASTSPTNTRPLFSCTVQGSKGYLSLNVKSRRHEVFVAQKNRFTADNIISTRHELMSHAVYHYWSINGPVIAPSAVNWNLMIEFQN
ncbi:hypothetical protein BD769DRAFT_1458806, partial [Suillus cothurnatus]